MDINKYKVLLSVAEKGSYSKVCEEFGYTQSGISKMIINMEDELGFPLVVRNNKGIVLTTEARRLMPHIRKLVSDMEFMEEELGKITDMETGLVKIGAFPSISFSYMSEILKNFNRVHPNIRVEVVEEHNIALLEQWLAQGSIDVGLFSRPSNSNFDWISLKREPFVAVMKKGHPLSAEPIVSVDDLFCENIVLFKPHEGEDPDIGFLDKYLAKYGVPKYTVNSDQTIVKMVVEDNFVTVFSELMAKQASQVYDVVYRPMDDYAIREFGIVLRSKSRMSPSTRKMVECIKETVLEV